MAHMTRKLILLAVSLILTIGLISCSRGKHLISDTAYRAKVESQFSIQKKLAVNRDKELFSVFDGQLTTAEREALEFLYAYMPLSDLADYDGEFYLRNVRASLAAKDTFNWGKTIPENIFLHFVLPVRVNNENMDSSRSVFFMELKDRIKHLSMKDAALEINHWCHEKVTYKGSDERTSAPLATIRNAYGRCGEESTFTVASLRAAGIPARQCYTPRWAHSDDNHAWVEVWIDGKWHYMGACEPEAVLDKAWFTGPAKRAMLVNTNVFGDYEGPEDVLIKDTRYTRINVLSNYTATKKIFVRIIGMDHKPVDSAVVEFQLYNYAEFYPLLRSTTGKDGLCSFRTGFGDLLVWAAKSNRFGYRKVTVASADTFSIQLNHEPGETSGEVLDFVPPPEQKTESTGSDSSAALNSKRLAFEDKLRADYENNFIDSSKTVRLARNLTVNSDTLWAMLRKSRGNWRNLIDFVSSVPPEKKPWIFPLFNGLSEKDLHDITPEVLDDNILNSLTFAPITQDKELFMQYILSPRVDNEYLRPWKAYFQHNFAKEFIMSGRKDPQKIVAWIRKAIVTDESANYGKAPITPHGVYDLKVSDAHSRDIFLVAVCRSFGIPARLEIATRTPQYYFNGKWNDVYFGSQPGKSEARVNLSVKTDPGNDHKPVYYTHFTIEKYKDGFFRSLDYENDPGMNSLPCTTGVVPGSYLLVTGSRMADGTVLSKLSFFRVEENKPTDVLVEMRKSPAPPAVLGTIAKNHDFGMKICATDLSYTSTGMIISWMDAEKEPSRHFAADLLIKKPELEKWNGNIWLLFREPKEMENFLKKNKAGLPRNVKCRVATAGSLEYFSGCIHLQISSGLPVITFINSRGEVNYLSQGYRIGAVDEILRLTMNKK